MLGLHGSHEHDLDVQPSVGRGKMMGGSDLRSIYQLHTAGMPAGMNNAQGDYHQHNHEPQVQSKMRSDEPLVQYHKSCNKSKQSADETLDEQH